VVDSGYESNEI